ncbi:MAG TPA: hypothetical protein VFT31_14855 [Kribbella sp.]|nr:hypothetical protein [Kribbella sp.]
MPGSQPAAGGGVRRERDFRLRPAPARRPARGPARPVRGEVDRPPAATTIVTEREKNGPYADMADLVRRTGLTAVQVEALATAGAFDFSGCPAARRCGTPPGRRRNGRATCSAPLPPGRRRRCPE